MITAEDKFESSEDALLSEMGINRNEADKLRKMTLDYKEAVIAKEEQLTTMRQSKGRKDDWEEWVDAKRRMGKPLHHSEFIRRLKLIVPTLIASRGRKNGTINLYKIQNTPIRETTDYTGSEKWNFLLPVFIGWIHEGVMPEYEIDIVNDVQIPISQKRGWRTILLRMITRWRHELIITNTAGVKEVKPKLDLWDRPVRAGRASIITEEQALEAFGYPTQGNTASAYRQQLWRFRNGVPDPIPDKHY